MAPTDDPSQDETLAILGGIPKVATLPLVPLDEYRRLARHLPPPTGDQIRAFASHVAAAKSWYKHLPFLPPGVPLQFFIDPWAGMDRMRTRDGEIIFGERTSDTFRFHYTWMTTADSCHKKDGAEAKGLLDNNPDRPVLAVPGYGEYRLPQEILDVGTTDVTAAIHAQTATFSVCSAALGSSDAPGPWPLESGGPEVLGKLRARCRAIEDAYRSAPSAESRPRLDDVDEELDRLLAPERRRQHEQMVLAIGRVVDLLYGASD
jgi:hypothetical protein